MQCLGKIFSWNSFLVLGTTLRPPTSLGGFVACFEYGETDIELVSKGKTTSYGVRVEDIKRRWREEAERRE